MRSLARHATSNQIMRFNAAMATDVDLTGFEALSFDCYGTLIDWEAGIAAVLAPWAREQGLDLTDEDLLLAYADNEAAVERETPSALLPRGPRRCLPPDRRWARSPGDRGVGAAARKLGPGLAGVPGLVRCPGPAGHALPIDHLVQRAPRRLRRQQPTAAR